MHGSVKYLSNDCHFARATRISHNALSASSCAPSSICGSISFEIPPASLNKFQSSASWRGSTTRQTSRGEGASGHIVLSFGLRSASPIVRSPCACLNFDTRKEATSIKSNACRDESSDGAVLRRLGGGDALLIVGLSASGRAPVVHTHTLTGIIIQLHFRNATGNGVVHAAAPKSTVTDAGSTLTTRFPANSTTTSS